MTFCKRADLIGHLWPLTQVTLNSVITKALSCLRHQIQLPNWWVWRLIPNFKRYVCVTFKKLLGLTSNKMHVYLWLSSIKCFQICGAIFADTTFKTLHKTVNLSISSRYLHLDLLFAAVMCYPHNNLLLVIS